MAINSFPVPDSPQIKTGASVFAYRVIRCRRSIIVELPPTRRSIDFRFRELQLDSKIQSRDDVSRSSESSEWAADVNDLIEVIEVPFQRVTSIECLLLTPR